MTPFLQFLLALMIILVAAKTAGYLSFLAHQPAVLGELSRPETGFLVVLLVLRVYGLNKECQDKASGF